MLGYRTVQEIENYLAEADIYCSATLGEGCSQARVRALLTGMPIATTLCGEIADLSEMLTGCYTAPCGDLEGYTAAVKAAYLAVRNPVAIQTPNVPEDVVRRFSEDEERRQWSKVIQNVIAMDRLRQ